MIDFHGSPGYGPGVYRLDQPRLGWQAARGSAEGPRGRAREVQLARRGRRLRAGRLVRRLHDELDPGQLSDRFRCIVNHDGVFDQRMMYYSTEELWFMEWENGGPQWDPGSVREIQPRGFRIEVAHAHARHPQRAGLPYSLLAGRRRIHRVTTPRASRASCSCFRMRITGC